MPNLYKRLYLIGYMASGKSTVGIKLAETIGYGFIDTDQTIEKLNGQTINRIFKEKGETAFRNEESKMALFTSQLENVVISTGGGLPIYNNNMAFLNTQGTTIYLKVDANSLVDRILQDNRNVRPLHKPSSRTVLLKDLKTRLAARKHQYESAQITIDGCQKTDIIVKNIITAIKQHKAKPKL